jgi:hypothetical protein
MSEEVRPPTSTGGFTNPMTTAGDLIVGDTGGAAARLAKGADSQVLTVDPTTHLLVWTTPASGAGFASPSIALDSSAAAGAAGTVIRSDSTIAAFDATVPVTQAFSDSAAVGSAAFAARRDHKHGMPSSVLPATLDVSADNTTADATTGHHGLLPKLGGGTTNFLRADGTWNAPGGGGLGAWTDYTPTWGSDATAPTLGNATLTGRYKQLDSKTYAIRVHFVYGSTSSPGTGAFSFTLPAGLTTIATTQVIAGILLDTGTRYYLGNGWLGPSGTKIDYVVHSESGTAGRAGAGAPQTWATGDEIYMDGIIEVA